MFYLKHQGSRIFIECDNVYTNCAQCGKEFPVDLGEILNAGGDLYATNIYCQECGARLKKKLNRETAE